MNTDNKYTVGYTGTYIHDLVRRQATVDRVCELPFEAAIAWLAAVAPDTNMGSGNTPKQMAQDLRVGVRAIGIVQHGWLNKLYVIVDDSVSCQPGTALAIYNHDGRIFLYKITWKERQA